MRRSLLVLLFLLLAGCTGAVDEQSTATLAPGQSFEVNLDLGSGVAWNWSASGPLAFNIHHHSGGTATYLVDEVGIGSQGTITARGPHSLMWTNSNPTSVQLAYRFNVRGDTDA